MSEKIRGYRVSIKVSSYAMKSEIRNFVYKQLRNSAKSNSLVIDGRDIGTVVFPDAYFKFFLFADSNSFFAISYLFSSDFILNLDFLPNRA